MLGRNFRQVFRADVQAGQQRQGNGTPEALRGQPGQRAPDLAVDELLPRRAGGRVVMHARPVPLGTIPCRGRIIQAEQEPTGRVRQQRDDDPPQKRARDLRGAAADASQQVVAGAEVGTAAARPQPGGDGATAPSKEYPDEEEQTAVVLPGIQELSQEKKPGRQVRGQGG